MKPRKRKSERDALWRKNKTLTNLLMWEASGGTIPLPAGVENYKPPVDIPFERRCAVVDMVNKLIMVGMKVDPGDEMSGFDILKEEMNEHERAGGKGERGGNPSEDASPFGDAFADYAARASDSEEEA